MADGKEQPQAVTISPPEVPGIVELPRGGYIVDTPAGHIQFGIPPETIKDAIKLGLEVPQIFVLGTSMFDRTCGVTTAEVEFPTYYNFFIKKRKITIITHTNTVDRIRKLFQETVFGPEETDWDLDFDPSVPEEQRPIGLEYRSVRDNLNESFNLDDMLEFKLLLEDSQGVYTLSLPSLKEGDEDVKIVDDIEEWVILHGTKPIAALPQEIRVIQPKWLRKVHQSFAYEFEPPMFGVTVLGASHGFDPKACTTGFVLWMNKRGIMVDPPLNSADLLHAEGIPSMLIEGVIVTHCHADHDGGTFQKILEQRRVKLITTHTIFKSFIEKYCSISNFNHDFLRRLFKFVPAVIGQPLRLFGGEIRFFYSVHTLPTIGFVAYLNGKSIYYSSDMCWIPRVLREMVKSGRMHQERADYFLHNNWNYSVILHEAGIPPIHTPVSELAKVSDEVKTRLYLVHIAEKDVPDDCGLRVAQVGVKNTITVPVTAPEFASSIRVLGLMESIDVFRDLPLARAREILQVAQTESYPAKTVIVRQNTAGDKFYIVERGAVEILVGEERRMIFEAGTWFGETSLVTNEPRSANVIAKTQVVLLSFRKQEFLSLLRGTNVVEELVHLATVRQQKSWETISANMLLSEFLSTNQRQQLQRILFRVPVEADEIIWAADSPADAAYIVEQGSFRITASNEMELAKLRRDRNPSVRGRMERSNWEGMTIPRPAAHSPTPDRDREELESAVPPADKAGFPKPPPAKRMPSRTLVAPSNPLLFGRGAFLGEVNEMLGEGPGCHATECVCLTSGAVFRIERKEMMKFFQDNPGVKVAFLDQLFVE